MSLGQAENLLAELTGASNPLAAATVEQITSEIKLLTNQAVGNFVEIGRRLIEVRRRLKHGEWGAWLENEVQFSDEQARKLMRLAEEYPNSNALWNLPLTKAFALLQVPPDERDDFVNNSHELPGGETKTVDEMTTRELDAALKARDAALKRAEEAERAKQEAYDLVHEKTETINRLQKTVDERPVKEVPKVPDDYSKLKKDVSRLTQDKQELLGKVSDLTSKVSIAENTARAYQTGSVDERMAIEVKVGVFHNTVVEFVGKAAPLAYLAKEYAHTSPACQRKYEDTISLLEKLVGDLRDNMIRPREGNVHNIEAEVIT